MDDLILVLTTCDRREVLEEIASELVEQNLAACCQISGPISSVYRWESKVETSQEFSCSIKTKRELFDQVEATILQLHSYEKPEIVFFTISGGNSDYLEWVATETR